MFEFIAGGLSLLSAILGVSTGLLVRQNLKQGKQIREQERKLLSEQNTSTKLLEAKEEAEKESLQALTGSISDEVIEIFLSKNTDRLKDQNVLRVLQNMEIPDFVLDTFSKKLALDEFGHKWKIHVSYVKVNEAEPRYSMYGTLSGHIEHPSTRQKTHRICTDCGLEHTLFSTRSERWPLSSHWEAVLNRDSGFFYNEEKIPRSFLCGKPPAEEPESIEEEVIPKKTTRRSKRK